MSEVIINVTVSATGTDVDKVQQEQKKYEMICKAAPDLYESLQAVLHMIAEKEGTSDENDAIYDAAKAALSKARGE